MDCRLRGGAVHTHKTKVKQNYNSYASLFRHFWRRQNLHETKPLMQFQFYNFARRRFLRAKAECFARLCHRLGVCLSVCHTRDLHENGASQDYEIFTLAAPRSLVYRDKIQCHWVQGFPSNEGVKEGYPLKRRHFAVMGSNNVKTVADRYIHAAYHNKHW